MNPLGFINQIGRAVADGFTLAAEILCPRDHTSEDRLRSWESAAVAVEGEICDEAEACEATSAAVSAAADPSPTDANTSPRVVGGEGRKEDSCILSPASFRHPIVDETGGPR